MTFIEYKEARAVLGLSVEEWINKIAISMDTHKGYNSGRAEVQLRVANYINAMLKLHDQESRLNGLEKKLQLACFIHANAIDINEKVNEMKQTKKATKLNYLVKYGVNDSHMDHDDQFFDLYRDAVNFYEEIDPKFPSKICFKVSFDDAGYISGLEPKLYQFDNAPDEEYFLKVLNDNFLATVAANRKG